MDIQDFQITVAKFIHKNLQSKTINLKSKEIIAGDCGSTHYEGKNLNKIQKVWKRAQMGIKLPRRCGNRQFQSSFQLHGPPK